ncbi:hypothetical protein [Novosphingobium soli]
MLGGCTVIPPADPSRMPPAERPDTPPQPSAPPPFYPPPPAAPKQAPLAYAALGQTVRVEGPLVTPLEVLEDSRCPMNARCVWAGQVRLRVRIESGRGGVLELTSGKPATVADGTLELVDVRPDKMAGSGNAVDPSAYRFGLRFSGGY